MILDIILLSLLLIFISISLFFIFFVLIPVLESQKMVNSQLMYGDLELKGNLQFKYRVKKTNKKAFITCNSDKKDEHLKVVYNGKKSCRLFYDNYGSKMYCSSMCIGLGDCVNACPVNAIVIAHDTAIVTDACVGCGLCVSVCPKKLIKMVDLENDNYETCNVQSETSNNCSMKNGVIKKSIQELKLFKFWKYCYKIIYKNR